MKKESYREGLLKLKRIALEKKDYETVKNISLELKEFNNKPQKIEEEFTPSLADLFTTEKEEVDYEAMYEQYKKDITTLTKEEEVAEIIAEVKGTNVPSVNPEEEQFSELLSDFNDLKVDYNTLVQFMKDSHKQLIALYPKVLRRQLIAKEFTSVCGSIGGKLREISALTAVKASKTDEES